jgi:hypothetical protein
VVVHGGENGIRLETFRVGDGIVHEAELTTDRTDLDLRLISSPKFMKVKLDKHRPGNSGRPRWTLTVEIPPGAIESGAFPRPGLEAYRDCTILLRIGGEDGRDFRIPVSGIARR